MVGNPPWVKQEWKEGGVLAEFEPWFELAEKPSNQAWAEHKTAVLVRTDSRLAFMGELADSAAMSSFLASVDNYPELVGTQPDLYRAFMITAWRAGGERGLAGLIHPATHLTGAKEGPLRRSTYRHLRLHADFSNAKMLFASPVGHTTHFSMNIYGRSRQIKFQHINWLFHPLTLTHSLQHSGEGTEPGIKHSGEWDTRPHNSRLMVVDVETLTAWHELAGRDDSTPVEESKVLFPVTRSEESAISTLAKWRHRLEALNPRISSGFHEKNDRTAGYFAWDSGPVDGWGDVILQAPFFGISTPFAKQPIEGARTPTDLEAWDHVSLDENALPRTSYRRRGTAAAFLASQDKWPDNNRIAEPITNPSGSNKLPDDTDRRPYSEFYRAAWRVMIPPETERSLMVCIVPPGPTHVDLVNTMALENDTQTTLVAGFWSALPSDYYVRANNIRHLRIGEASYLPVPSDGHPLTPALLLRTLRLNCQSRSYAQLWADLFKPSWLNDRWTFSGIPFTIDGIGRTVDSTWTRETPLRAEFERRAALVEIDALVAVWLGISADELVAMYRSRFPVLQQYEENMWFDATGRRITKAHQVHGYGQPKDAWKQLSSHENFPLEANVPDSYEGPLYRADRVKEMRAAHAEFTRRLRAAGWEPGDTEPPAGAEK